MVVVVMHHFAHGKLLVFMELQFVIGYQSRTGKAQGVHPSHLSSLTFTMILMTPSVLILCAVPRERFSNSCPLP
jgi:hypothetical protein